MAVCVLQNFQKYRVLWTDFSASCREINWFSVSKIGPEPAKPTISLVLLPISCLCSGEQLYFFSYKMVFFFSFQNNSRNLDPYMMDLDFQFCFRQNERP